MNRWSFMMVGALMATGLTLAAQEPPLPGVTAVKFAAAPKLDGRLDDACWQQAAKIELNRLLGTTNAPAVKTEAWLGYDDQWLYIAVRCADQPGAQIKANLSGWREHSWVPDDNIEIFLNASGRKYNYFHFLLTAGGASREQIVTGPETGQRYADWSVTWPSATRVEQAGWTAELAIPLFILGQKNPPAFMPFNIVRTKQTEPKQNITWAPVGGKSMNLGYHDPAHFGALTGLEGVALKKTCDPILMKADQVTPYQEKDSALSYTFTAKLVNWGGQTGATEIVVEDTTADGVVTLKRETVAVPANGKQEYILTVPVAQPSDRKARVTLAGQEANPRNWRNVAGTDVLTTLLAYPNLSYYSGEPVGRLTVGVAFRDADFAAKKLSLKVDVKNAEGVAALAKTYAAIANQGVVLEFPAATWKPGRYPVAVELLNAEQKTMAKTATAIRIEAPPPAGIIVTKIDREKMCLLKNGQPFFPFGFTLSGLYTNLLVRMASAGFTVVVDWDDLGYGVAFGAKVNPDGTWWTAQSQSNMDLWISKREPAYRLAGEKGLPVIATTVGNISLGHSNAEYNHRDHKLVMEKLPGVINRLKLNPGILAWKGLDEPDKTIYGIMKEHGELIRALDPYHVIWSSARGLGPEWYDGVYDIYSYHAYYSPEEGPRRLAWLIHSAYQTAKMGRCPVIATPQGQRLTYGRELTPDERRAGLYLSLINGAKGFWLFAMESYQPYNDVIWRILSYTAKECAILAPILFEERPPQAIDVQVVETDTPATLPPLPKARTLYDPSSPGQFGWGGNIPLPLVQASVWDLPEGGELILIANSGNQQVKVNCALSSLGKAGKIRAYFGGQELAVKDGQFTLALEPYGTRALATIGSKRKPGDPLAMGLTVVRTGGAEPAKAKLKVEDRRVTYAGYEKKVNSAVYSAVDDIEQMEADAPAKPGENIVKNSSFEECTLPGMPDRWAGHTYNKSYMVVESKDSYDGTHCLLLPISYKRHWGSQAGYQYFSNWEFGKTYMFSAYVKAEKAGGKIQLAALPYQSPKESRIEKEFDVGTNWTRVAFTISPIKEGPGRWSGPVVLVFANQSGDLNTPFKIWVDAVQLELGDQATSYKRDSYQAPKIDQKWLSDDVFKELEKR